MMSARHDLREIVARLGGDLYDGGTSANVPGPGHSKRDRSLSLRLMPTGRLLWCSFAPVEPDAVWNHLGLDGQACRQMNAAEASQARQERERERRAAEARRMAFCDALWRVTLAAEGTPVEAYLRGARAIAGAIPPSLRYAAAAPLGYHPSARRLPAMVALAHRPDGAAAGLHVTFIEPDGSDKISMANPRRMFWRLEGGAIRLGSVGNSSGVLAVAEGVETALSYRDLTGVPTWAAGSAASLARFVPPPRITWLVVASDSDDDGGGLQAALELAARVRRRCRVTVAAAPVGKDWNTVRAESGK
jgi:putative DNA primase/helicase